MSAKIKASSDGLKVTIGNAAEDALEINHTAKTIAALAPYLLKGDIAAQSLTGNGYVKLASGLIIQWGVSGSVSGQERVTFPTPFPNAFLQAVATPSVPSQVVDLMYSTSIYNPTLVDMFVIKRYAQATASVAVSSIPCSWIAIGY